jgi:hypothetical protein
MRASLVVGLLAAVLSASPAFAFSHVVSRSGRIGNVRIGKAHMDQVRAQEGNPSTTRPTFGEGGVAATEWRYGCGHGRGSSYFFNGPGVLVNFITTCHSWRTANGTRVGDTQAEAEAKEGKQASASVCGDGRTIERRGTADLFITFLTEQGPVRALALAGRGGVLGC